LLRKPLRLDREASARHEDASHARRLAAAGTDDTGKFTDRLDPDKAGAPVLALDEQFDRMTSFATGGRMRDGEGKRTEILACSPKSDPVGMRVSTAPSGQGDSDVEFEET
jgi:hypothetical protein